MTPSAHLHLPYYSHPSLRFPFVPFSLWKLIPPFWTAAMEMSRLSIPEDQPMAVQQWNGLVRLLFSSFHLHFADLVLHPSPLALIFYPSYHSIYMPSATPLDTKRSR